MTEEIRNIVFSGNLRSMGGTSIVASIAYGKFSKDLGGFRERIVPGAFKTENRDVKLLWQHDPTKPLASTAGGTLKLMDSDKSMNVIAHLDPSISFHSDALAAVKRRDASGLSFGFRVLEGGDRWTTDADGNRIRELRKIEAREFSVVTFPAYPDSKADVRKDKTSITHRRTNEMNLQEKRTERNRLFQQIRTLEGKADISVTEEDELRKLDQAYDALDQEIKREELRQKNDIREMELSASQRTPTRPMPTENRQADRSETRADREDRQAVEHFTRALQMDVPTSGGYMVLPQTVQTNVITKLKDDLFVLNRADVITVENAGAVSWPAVDHDPGDYSLEFTGEILTGAEDSTMDFDARQLSPHPVARRIKISKKLVRASGIDVVNLVRDRMAYVFGMVLEHNFLNGNGSNKPLGIFSVSAHGINTDRDVSEGNTTTQIKADNLIEAAYTLKAQYLKRASWVFHRDAMKQIRKLKDGEGAYLFQPQLTESTPAMLLGRPVDVSEYCPSTFTSGSYVGALLDWSFYKIVFALNFDVQILNELYAEFNQLGLIARIEVDGMPALAESAVRIKLGS
jgi:HK97 family phage major capsid protein/HK97 family phage prohead protease